jgi:hypothetical protein
VLFDAENVPELAASSYVGICRSHAAIDVFVTPHCQMEGELVGEITVQPPAAEQRDQPPEEHSHSLPSRRVS